MKEAKTSSIPFSHISLHNSGQTNVDFVGKSGRLNSNNVNHAVSTTKDGQKFINYETNFTRADGTKIIIEKGHEKIDS